MPMEIAYASRQFLELLAALKRTAYLETHTQCYAMLRAVLHEFRRYLTIPQALALADALPPIVRAIFVEDWQPADPPRPPSPQAFDAAVTRRLAPHHAPPGDIALRVFEVLQDRSAQPKLARALAALPAGLRTLWHPPDD